MSQLNKTSLEAKFNDSGTGLFKTGQSRGIGSDDQRTLITDLKDSVPFILDDTYKSYAVTASGTDTYTATLSPVITSYETNTKYYIKFTNANTGAATLNLNSLGAKSIVKNGSTALAAGNIGAGQILELIYDGTNLQISGIVGSGGSGTVNSGTQYRIAYYAATGTAVSEASAITAARALKSDANGVPTHFDTATEPSLTELTYVKGVTSAIQTQLNGKQSTLTNPVTGTGTINEITYFTGASTVSSLSVATYPSLTELSYVKGVTSSIQTQLGTKWALTGTSTLTGAATITSNAENQHIFNGTWTATASNSYHLNFGGTFTTRNTNGDTLLGYKFTPTLVVNAGAPTSQILAAIYIDPTFTGTATKYAVYQPTTNTSAWFIGGSIFTPTSNAYTLLTAQGYGISMNTSNSKVEFASQDSQIYHSGSNSNTIRVGQQQSNATTARTFVSWNIVNSVATAHAPTTGTDVQWDLTTSGNCVFQPSSGTATWTTFLISTAINQTGTASGAITYFDINPTRTSVLGTEYGILVRPTTCLNGFGTATPTAVIDVAASSTARASMRIRSGTAPSSPNEGDFWYDGTNLKFRDSTTSRTITWT